MDHCKGQSTSRRFRHNETAYHLFQTRLLVGIAVCATDRAKQSGHLRNRIFNDLNYDIDFNNNTA